MKEAKKPQNIFSNRPFSVAFGLFVFLCIVILFSDNLSITGNFMRDSQGNLVNMTWEWYQEHPRAPTGLPLRAIGGNSADVNWSTVVYNPNWRTSPNNYIESEAIALLTYNNGFTNCSRITNNLSYQYHCKSVVASMINDPNSCYTEFQSGEIISNAQAPGFLFRSDYYANDYCYYYYAVNHLDAYYCYYIYDANTNFYLYYLCPDYINFVLTG